MKRYKHSLSNYKLATTDMGKLVPVQLQEVLPGDTFRMQSSALIRMSPMVAPVMHPVTVRIHHWFVPSRLLWDGWEDFITGKDTSLQVPTLTVDNDANDHLLDYFGAPVITGSEVNALPFRAYNMIYNEFYRDQDLIGEVDLDGQHCHNVSWRKDYFTAARPWPQKGPDIVLPIGDRAPVAADGTADSLLQVQGSDGDDYRIYTGSTNASMTDPGNTGVPMYADLSQATGVTATEFREFFALQRYAEARARYGSRYSEYLRYLGVRPSDARLQRPEYLGGGKSTIQISEVLQTAYDSSSPVGTLRGHGISALKTKGVRRFFEEHGYVLTLMSVVPKSIYVNGAQRLFFKREKEDFFQKELQSIGQQPIKQGEIYLQANDQDNHKVFGYQDRYSEYTSAPSTVAGEFRSILDFWHLGRKFDQAPHLNQAFVECQPSKRIFAAQQNHTLLCMINNRVVARRMVKNTSVGRLM